MYSNIFFYKQKTAYELRMCDWSSDVCSSDLADGVLMARPQAWCRGCYDHPSRDRESPCASSASTPTASVRPRPRACSTGCARKTRTWSACRKPRRSEEHTSELQSLMRISYAVFCLKKKKQ